MKLFRKRAPLIIELPEVCGARLSAPEVKLALEDKGMTPVVRAVVQLLVMTRADYLKSAQAGASRGADVRFDLGAAQAVEDVLAEVLGLIGGEVSDDVKAWFNSD